MAEDQTSAPVQESPVSAGSSEPEVQSTQEQAQPETPATPEMDQETQYAKDLYASLRDPSKSREVVKFLAAQTGLKIQDDGVSPTQATKQTVDALKEGVPPELHFLVDNLKPVIEKIVSQNIEKAVAPVKQAQMQDKEQLVMGQITQAYDVMRGRYKDFDKQENRMNRLAEEMPYKPGSDMVKYLDNLYKLSTFENKETEAVKHVVNRINKNAKEHVDVPSAETSAGTVQLGSKLPSLREAVMAGVRGVKLQ